MRVNFAYSIGPSFTSTCKTTRTADDIQRKSRGCFPVFSPTYANTFYNVLRPTSKKYYTAQDISDKFLDQICLDRKLNTLKYSPEIIFDSNFNYVPYTVALEKVRESHLGNCLECAYATMAALAANGYNDFSFSTLGMCTSFINKEIKEVEYKVKDEIDHGLVIADMDNDGVQETVIDSWLGFADKIPAAVARYKALYNNEETNMRKRLARVAFAEEKQKKSEKVNFDDYEIKTSFYFSKSKELERISIDKFGKHVREHYDKLLLNSKQ